MAEQRLRVPSGDLGARNSESNHNKLGQDQLIFGIRGKLNKTQFIPVRSGSFHTKAAILADQRHRSPSPPPFTHRDNRAVTRRAVRSPLAGQDSVGAASAFYPGAPGDPTRGRHSGPLRPWPGGERHGRCRPSDGQGWAEPPGPSEDAPAPGGSHTCPQDPSEPLRWGSQEPESRSYAGSKTCPPCH